MNKETSIKFSIKKSSKKRKKSPKFWQMNFCKSVSVVVISIALSFALMNISQEAATAVELHIGFLI